MTRTVTDLPGARMLATIVGLAILRTKAHAQFGGGFGGGFHPGLGGCFHPGLGGGCFQPGLGRGGFHPGYGYDPMYPDPFHHMHGYQEPYMSVRQQPTVIVDDRRQPVRKEQPKAPPLFRAKSPVKKLSPNKFPDQNSEYLWLVAFHDNGKDSKQIKKPVEILANGLKGKHQFKVGAFDCRADEEAESYCRLRVGSLDDLPRFGFVVDGELEFSADDPELTAKVLHNFAREHVKSERWIHKVDTEHALLHTLIPSADQRNTAAILLVTDKLTTSSLYAGLSYKYRHRLVFGESRDANENVAKLLIKDELARKEKGYPFLTAYVKTTSGFDVVWYEGAMQGPLIYEWLDGIVYQCERKRVE